MQAIDLLLENLPPESTAAESSSAWLRWLPDLAVEGHERFTPR